MSGIARPLVKRRSFVLEYNKQPHRLSRTESCNAMSWSAAPQFPPGARLPPGYGIGSIQEEPRPLPPGPHLPKSPQDCPVKLSLKLEPEDRDTDLARICSDSLHELPQMVKVGERFSVPGNDLKLEKGESLLLLFIAELPRVHAVDMTDKSEVWLPVHCEQVFERLPLDPRLDDKLYMGATALMNAKPMPSIVRVLEGYGSDDYSECVDQEDVIHISHTEEKMRRDKQKVLIAKNQLGHRLELHQDMECAYFTTMMSALFLYMSQLIEFEFPQRVRVVEETTFENRKPKEEKIFKLLSFKKDLQVIATRAKKPGLLSIPITVPLAVSTITMKEKTVQSCLPALFPTVNLTWDLQEFGRPELAKQLKEISQPLPETIRAWLDSFEGKERVCEVAKVSKADLIRDLKELTNYNRDLANRIAFLSQAERPVIPTRDKTIAPPPRPSKPTTLRRLPPPPAATKPPTATKPPKSALNRSLTSVADVKKMTKFHPVKSRAVSADGYEVADPFDSSDNEDDCDYEEMPSINDGKDAADKTLEETCRELKMILQQKEKKIARMKEENEKLEETCKNLEKDKEMIRQSNFKHIEEIHRLQGEIDQLVSKDDLDIYDIIRPTDRPLPTLPQSTGGVIYSTPDALLVERALMPRTDIEGIADILRQVGLSRYIDKFKEEEVDGALLTTLDETVLKEDLGMTGLHARKLMLEVKKHAK